MGQWQSPLQQEQSFAPQHLGLQAASAWRGAVNVDAAVASRTNPSKKSFLRIASPPSWEPSGNPEMKIPRTHIHVCKVLAKSKP
jgi:hypothetical protein